MRLRLFAVAILVAGSLCAADPQLLSLAPPDTQAMAGVNVQQVSLSPIGQYLLAQNPQQTAAGLEKLMAATGFDPRHDLQELLIAANVPPGNKTGLILVRGTFDVPRIIEAALAAGAKVESYKGVQVIQQKGMKEQAAAFPDSTTAIIGDTPSVEAAIDRKSAPTAISSALAVAVNMASTTEDAWFVTMVPPSKFQPRPAGAGAQEPSPFAILDTVMQANGGVKLGANVVVTVNAICKSAQDAATLAETVKSLAGMLGSVGTSGDAGQAAVGEMLKNLSITSSGATATLSLSMPEQQIEQRMQMKGDPNSATGWDVRSGRYRGVSPPPKQAPQR